MKNILKLKIYMLVIISFISVWAIQDNALAVELGANEGDLSSIGSGWTVHDDELVGRGPAWAGYGKSCYEEPLALSFKIEELTGGLHVNINMDGSDRYAIGLINEGNSSLATYQFKQVGANPPTSNQRFPGRSIDYNQTREYQVEIFSQEGNIQVFIHEIGQERELSPVIDYIDPDPLAPGEIDFEALNSSSVRLSDVTVTCSSRIEEKAPDLGVGYFKPPG